MSVGNVYAMSKSAKKNIFSGAIDLTLTGRE
jgi:hypothetical protein